MMFLTALCLWLHDIATVLYIGFFLLQALVFLPLFRSRADGTESDLLVVSMKRFQPLASISLLIFLVSGVVLMLVNPDYHGLGQFTNLWSIVMMLKHVVIIAMVVLGTRLQAQARQMGEAEGDQQLMLQHFGLMLNVQSVLGVLVLFMTALARMG